MRNAEEVLASQVFPRFREYLSLESNSVTDVAKDISAIGKEFVKFGERDKMSPEGFFQYRLTVMDVGVLTPLLLWLFSESEDIGEERLRKCLAALESYLVRRMVCKKTNKDYNNLFLELIKVVQGSKREEVDIRLVEFLAGQKSDSRDWPNDRDLSSAFESLPIYQLLTRGRLRIVLEAIEDYLRSPKSEQEHAPRGTLTIEHLMPQGWRQHWPLPTAEAEEIEDAKFERDRLIHSIGNLTLVNQKLNSALSNGPWDKKLQGLQEHSVLALNKNILIEPPPIWDESSIRARGVKLAETASLIWPSATGFQANN